MTVRLVALDLDRTLLGFDGEISERNREAVRWAVSRDVIVTLATGRRFVSAAEVASELGLDVPLITFGGAYVADAGQTRVYIERVLSRDRADSVLDFAWREGYVMNAYTHRDVFSTQRDEVLKSGYWNPDSVQQWRPGGIPEGQGLLQLTAVGEQSVRAVGEFVESQFPGAFRYDVFSNQRTWTGHLLEPNASKGRALKSLARQFGVSRNEVLALGDECNDVDMIEWAGTGIAMFWATDDVLKVADDVSPQGDPDGVATMLYRYLR